MRRSSLSWAKPVAGALALLMTFAALPAASAAEAPRTGAAKASLTSAVAAKVVSLKATPRAFQTATPRDTNPPDDRSFLSTGRGRFALALMTAGIGYAAYSAFKDNDAVHSPIR